MSEVKNVEEVEALNAMVDDMVDKMIEKAKEENKK